MFGPPPRQGPRQRGRARRPRRRPAGADGGSASSRTRVSSTHTTDRCSSTSSLQRPRWAWVRQARRARVRTARWAGRAEYLSPGSARRGGTAWSRGGPSSMPRTVHRRATVVWWQPPSGRRCCDAVESLDPPHYGSGGTRVPRTICAACSARGAPMVLGAWSTSFQSRWATRVMCSHRGSCATSATTTSGGRSRAPSLRRARSEPCATTRFYQTSGARRWRSRVC